MITGENNSEWEREKGTKYENQSHNLRLFLFVCFGMVWFLLEIGLITTATTCGWCVFLISLIATSAARSGLCAHRYVHCIYK